VVSHCASHRNTGALTQWLEIRLITPPVFLATKLEAFRERGEGDFLASHDLEDIVVVIDGRPELADEIRDSEPELREYLVREFDSLLCNSAFVEALPGYLPADAASQARLPTIRERLRLLAS
jgi:hypothetical protein